MTGFRVKKKENKKKTSTLGNKATNDLNYHNVSTTIHFDFGMINHL